MPKVLTNVLTAAAVRSAKPGRYGDGGGLFLLVKPTGRRTWLFRYKLAGKVRDMGLGAAAGPGAVTLADARVKAAGFLRTVRGGVDPLEDRAAQAAAAVAQAQVEKVKAITFKAVAIAYIEAHESSWRNAKHRAQWTATLEAYAYPHFGGLPIADVATEHVMAALEPIWRSKAETASRLRGRIESVLDYAKARGWRAGENPARWRGHIANMLPTRAKVVRVEHHAALPWLEISTFMADLRTRKAVAARALEFAILTAARTGEVLGARWAEIDRRAQAWIVPAERMKAGREHRVPLSTAALAVLDGMAPLRSGGDGEGFVFPGTRTGQPLSQMAMLMLLRRMGRTDLTAHGFRSTFRDWAAEATNYPHEMAEIALAHAVGDKVEAAYRRGDMMERRRRLMEDWVTFCGQARIEPPGKVRALRGA